MTITVDLGHKATKQTNILRLSLTWLQTLKIVFLMMSSSNVIIFLSVDLPMHVRLQLLEKMADIE